MTGVPAPGPSLSRQVRRFMLLACLATLVIGCALILAMRHYLTAELERWIEVSLKLSSTSRSEMVRQHVELVRASAIELATRIRLRDLLAAYNAGTIDGDELVAATDPSLRELLKRSPLIVGIVQLDARGRAVDRRGEVAELPELARGDLGPEPAVLPAILPSGRPCLATAADILGADGPIGRFEIFCRLDQLESHLLRDFGLGSGLRKGLLARIGGEAKWLIPFSGGPPPDLPVDLFTLVEDERYLAGGVPVGITRPIPGVPLAVVLSLSKRTLVEERRDQARLLVLGLVGGTLLSALALAAALRPLARRIDEQAGRVVDSERRQREQADELARSVAEFATTFDLTTVGLVQVGIPSGAYERVNEAYARMLGYTREELARLDFAAVTHPDDRAADRDLVAKLFSGELGVYQREKRYLRKDGGIVWAEVSAVAIHGTDGKPVRTITAAVDVTERKRAEDSLRASEERFRLVVEQISDYAIFLLDTDGRITSWNDGARRMLGYSEAESIGMPSEVIFTPEDRAAGAPAGELATAIATGCAFDERWHLRKSGERFYVSGALTAIRDGAGRLIGLAKIMRDETQRQQLEARLRLANDELERFAAAASHDLQEPLRMVASYLSLTAKRYGEHLPEQGRSWLGTAVDGAERMHRLIDDLLEYSRAGRARITAVPVAMTDVYQDALANLRERIAATCGSVERGDLPVVLGDRPQLARLLQNLLGNALKYHRPGVPPTVRVTARREDGTWVVAVRDNGLGIPAEARERVFSAFERLHGVGEYAGTGLGLAICQRIVARHGGRIWVEAAEDGGSVFLFTLPDPPGPAGTAPPA
jgi:PAS domain S-box-containing protein